MEARMRHRKRNADATEDGMSDPDHVSDEPSSVAAPKDDTPEYLKDALKDLPPKWKNWWIRGLFSVFMLVGFFLLVYGGPYVLMLTILCIQVKCFHEIITIGHQYYRFYDLPWFRSLSWYFLIAANYFFYGETRGELVGNISEFKLVTIFVRYHRMISLMLYLLGFILFVLSLVKKRYRLQFFMFGWTHVSLLIIVTQSHLIIQNLFDGMIWLLVPVSMVICNDSMAYICGFFFGRTQLIKLSPKKTWEGFIGGGIFTVILGWFFSGFLSQFQYVTCPTELGPDFVLKMECETPAAFVPGVYQYPAFVQVFGNLIGLSLTSFTAVPFQFHCLAFSLFSSLIAPFGGFFASGFKRAFKIKDFGDVIPGHGGLLDRFDCQFLMATFVHVYMSTFIRSPSPHSVLPMVLAMKRSDQIWLFKKLKEHLAHQEF